MAYQKQIYQDGVTEYTDTLFEHMDDGIFGAYPVQLIAISDTAPSQCVENDKYYNTSTKKIYTATGTNTWGTNGETPLEDTAYWLISENGSYAWNGTDLVSIGGGKAEVVISDEEPEEGKLWVDTGEIQVVAGKENLVNVGTNVDNSFRTNILKSKNLFDASNVLDGMGISSGGSITTATDNGLFYIPVIAGKTYVFSFTDNGVSGNIVWGYTSQVPANGVSCTYNVMTNASLNGAIFTPTGTQKYLCIRLNTTANNQYNAMSNIQCEEGSTATTYEPYITPSINVDGEEIYSKMKVYTDTYATYFKFDKMVCCVVNRQTQTTDGTVATIPSEFACANDMRNVINYYNGSSYVSGILWSQNVGLYIRDMYGNIPSNASFIRGMLIWEAKN